MTEPRTAVVVDGTDITRLPEALAAAEGAPGATRLVVVTSDALVEDAVEAVDAHGPRLRVDLAVGDTPHDRVWAALQVVTSDVRFGLLDAVTLDQTYDATDLLDAYVAADRTGLAYDSPAACLAAARG